jgi:cytochrome c oxidase cbb3-type subunit 3
MRSLMALLPRTCFGEGAPVARRVLACCGVFVALAVSGCEREKRDMRLDPPIAAAMDDIRLLPNRISGAPPEVYFVQDKPYEHNAYQLNQGKRLYTWFGCATCHSADGSGGAGPSFLDGWWLYGPEMVSVAASIRDGRPHGMPAFRDKMTTEQVWQLAGYIRTIGTYSAKTAAPSRNDDKQSRPAENRAPAAILFNEGAVNPNPDQGPRP